MSSDDDARKARQDKIAAAAPRQRNTRPLVVAVAVIAVLAIVGAVAWGVVSNRAPETTSSGAYPQGATGPAGGIVAAGQPRPGAPTLDVYEDFQCPACKQAHDQLGATITQMAQSGEARVVYHMKSFLDANLGNDSSKRAANAAACAADQGAFQAYHDAIYAHQPAQEGTGFTDADLTSFAEEAGLSGDRLQAWQQCESSDTYAGYVQRVEEQTARDGVTATPTFRVNGTDLDLRTVTSAEDFRSRVLAAGGASPSSAPASSPDSPAPSGSR